MKCYINDLVIHYQQFGSGKPILCIHGFPEDHRTMTGCIEPILHDSTTYRRIYLDLPGMGKSEAKTWIYNADVMLEVLELFIQKVIGDEAFLLVGLSYGGYLSLGLMLQEKLKIDGVFLVCPCTVSDSSKRILPEKGQVILDKDLDIKNKENYTGFLEYAVIANETTWRRYQNEILVGLQCADESFLNEYRRLGYGFTFESQFNKIMSTFPISVITGMQDNCVGFEDSWNVLKHLPQLDFIKVDNAGHNLQIEQENIFNSSFCNWLEKLSDKI